MTSAAFFDLDNTLIRGSSMFHLARGLRHYRFLTDDDVRAFVWQNFKFVLIYQSTYRFEVYHGAERLGQVSCSTDRYGDVQVLLSNDRIRNTLVRGNSIKTKDIKKALRLMAKYFKVKTQREMVDNATALLRDNINANASAFHSTFHTTKMRVMLALTKHVVDNFAELREVALCAGAKPESLDNFLSQHDEFELSGAIQDAFINKRGYSVVLKDSDYIVTRLVDCDTVILKSDVLPSGIKQKVGMLKLVGPLPSDWP